MGIEYLIWMVLLFGPQLTSNFKMPIKALHKTRIKATYGILSARIINLT